MTAAQYLLDSHLKHTVYLLFSSPHVSKTPPKTPRHPHQELAWASVTEIMRHGSHGESALNGWGSLKLRNTIVSFMFCLESA